MVQSRDFTYVHLGYVEISLSRFYYFYAGNTQNNFFFGFLSLIIFLKQFFFSKKLSKNCRFIIKIEKLDVDLLKIKF